MPTLGVPSVYSKVGKPSVKGPDNKFSFMAMWSLLHLLYRVDNTERNGQGCVPIRLDVQQGWAWPTGRSLPTPAGVWRQRAWV